MGASFPEICEHIKKLVGKTTRLPVGVMNRLDFERFAAASGDGNPLFLDDAFARAHGYPAAIAPPLYLSSLTGGAIGEAGPPERLLRPDGIPIENPTGVPAEGLRLMGAGQDLEFYRPVTAATEVVMEWTITDVEVKKGRSGPLLLVQAERKFLAEDGGLLVLCRESVIGR